MGLMQEFGQRALDRGVPLSVQLDVTYRCNERCIHCYLDHDDHGGVRVFTCLARALCGKATRRGQSHAGLEGKVEATHRKATTRQRGSDSKAHGAKANNCNGLHTFFGKPSQ